MVGESRRLCRRLAVCADRKFEDMVKSAQDAAVLAKGLPASEQRALAVAF